MIIVQELQPYHDVLEQLIEQVVQNINNTYQSKNQLISLAGLAFEKEICDQLNNASVNSVFDNRFEQTSRFALPDKTKLQDQKSKAENWLNQLLKNSPITDPLFETWLYGIFKDYL